MGFVLKSEGHKDERLQIDDATRLTVFLYFLFCVCRYPLLWHVWHCSGWFLSFVEILKKQERTGPRLWCTSFILTVKN